MRTGAWWTDTLETFAAAWKVQLIIAHSTEQSGGKPGEWWLQDGDWCVQLDRNTYAQLLALPNDAAIRRALTVALMNASVAADAQLSWQDVLLQHFNEQTRDALTDNWRLKSGFEVPVDRIRTRDWRPPGTFLWLEFEHGGEGSGEFHDLVEEVVGALDLCTFIGWTAHPFGHAAALVFLEEAEAEPSGDWDDETELDDDWDRVSPAAGNARTRRHLRVTIHSLLGALETDAMVSVRATSGARIEDMSAWLTGLHTVMLAWRERFWFSPEQPVYLWGERPFSFLLANLRLDEVDPFIDMVSERTGRVGDLLLPAELAETLQGMLTANLNISEASRLLYLHRNTLMHRIERIRSLTGYDVRQFDNALLLWIAQSLLRRRRESGPSGSV